MTIDEVFNMARRMNWRRRAAAWTACGTHDERTLLTADSPDGAPWRYCQTCWTVFDMSGSYAVNAPHVAETADEPAGVTSQSAR